MLPAHDANVLMFFFLTGGLVAAAMVGIYCCFAPLRRAVRPQWAVSEEGAHRCRYCHLGRAFLHDEQVRVEADDLVEVRLFVCRSCSLPTWIVERSPLLNKEARRASRG